MQRFKVTQLVMTPEGLEVTMVRTIEVLDPEDYNPTNTPTSSSSSEEEEE